MRNAGAFMMVLSPLSVAKNRRRREGVPPSFAARRGPPTAAGSGLFKLQHALDFRPAILRAAGEHEEVVADPRLASPVRVAAQHGDVTTGEPPRDLEQRLTGRHAGEVRRPVIVRDPPLVPTRL